MYNNFSCRLVAGVHVPSPPDACHRHADRACVRSDIVVEADPFWSQSGAMPVNLSVKNAPDHIVQRLRQRAERNHRSLQGELMAIIEAAVREDRPATPADILAEVRRLGLQTPGEAAALVRAD